MAQYISSRADIVPDAFSDELSALQDAVPPSSLAEVGHIIHQSIHPSSHRIYLIGQFTR